MINPDIAGGGGVRVANPASILFEVTTVDRKYINEAEALTTVSFQLPSSCWNQLQKSPEWNQFQSKLQEIQSKYIQTFRHEREL